MKHLESTVFKGTSVFAFGDARSQDIAGLASEEELAKDYTAGILQKDNPHLYGKLNLAGNYFSSARIENYNWWRAEMPTQIEMATGLKNSCPFAGKCDFSFSQVEGRDFLPLVENLSPPLDCVPTFVQLQMFYNKSKVHIKECDILSKVNIYLL